MAEHPSKKQSAEIRLTPAGNLRLFPGERNDEPGYLSTLEKTFQDDWREGLFMLAAEKIDPAGSSTFRFWQAWAARYLTALCHIPEAMGTFEIEPPPADTCEIQALSAPPMAGGEYLSGEVLAGTWRALDHWVRETLDKKKTLGAFLAVRAPRWHQVGRVSFHLAENKKDESRPFAFMATFATGFGAGGQLKHLPLGKALELYAGAGNRPALVKLLAPVEEAARRCDWVRELVNSRRIYQPMAWTAERAYRLLKSVPVLEESGLSVRLPNWWKKRPRPRVSVTIGDKHSLLGAETLLSFDVRVALGDDPLSPEEITALLDGPGGLICLKGQWVEVDRERLAEAIDHWKKLRTRAKDGGISFIEGMRLLAGASADLKDDREAGQSVEWAHVTAGETMREILAGLRDPARLAMVDPERNGLGAVLRPYQREGLNWLHFLSELGLGACLADDMGLGKTLQVLALLLAAARSENGDFHQPSLLVVPASLLGNWRNEAKRFAPDLKLLFVHPAETDRPTLGKIAGNPGPALARVDLVVTTYSLVDRQPWLVEQSWRWVILDEAQMIKNPATRQSRAVKKLPARARIILTGTPIENRLSDLWSLFDFLNPGLLGSAALFSSFVKTLQERTENPFGPLRQLVGPYILRRMKTDRRIIADLPEKTEVASYCPLTRTQATLYEKTVTALKDGLDNLEGMARRGLVLQTLTRLKQICNHPSQLLGDGDYQADRSGKFTRLGEICEEIAGRQEKVLIFTQFREIIPPLAAYLAGIFRQDGLVLHGGTAVNHRRTIVDRFQDENGPPFFILSLRAGGTGLNLTAAAHVIHFDRWWNPAVENQATDRAFRIGQRQNVLVHKFITLGTVEERIDGLIDAKRHLAGEILSGDGEVNFTELPDDKLIELVRLDVTRAMA